MRFWGPSRLGRPECLVAASTCGELLSLQKIGPGGRTLAGTVRSLTTGGLASQFAPDGRQFRGFLQRRRRLRQVGLQLAAILLAVVCVMVVPRTPTGIPVPGPEVTEMLVGLGAPAFGFIALVYSLLFLAVQFGTTTLTPRLNLFRDDPIVWRSFSYFTWLGVISTWAGSAVQTAPSAFSCRCRAGMTSSLLR